MDVCSLCCSMGLSLTCGMGERKRGGRKETGFVLDYQVGVGYGMWGVGWLSGYSVGVGMEWTMDYRIGVE